MRRKKVYIHYGASHFDPHHPLGGGHCGKPNGLWASPRYSKLGWAKWCESEEFHTERLAKHFKFRLQKGTRILKIKCIDDIIPFLMENETYKKNSVMFPVLYSDPTAGKNLDMQKIKSKYDGMEVYMDQNYGELHNSNMFNVWDVDSLVIWNLDKVICV